MALSVLRSLCKSRTIGTQVSLPCNRAEGTVGLREQPNYIAVEQAQCLIVHLLKCLGSLWMLMYSMKLILIKIVEKNIHHSSDQVTVLSNMSKVYNKTIIRILAFCVFDEVLVSFHSSPDGNISFI